MVESFENLGILVRGPVDSEGHLVMMLMEFSGSITGEFEDGRATHAPVGDEQRTGGTGTGARNLGSDLIDDSTHQGLKGFVIDGEGEE